MLVVLAIFNTNGRSTSYLVIVGYHRVVNITSSKLIFNVITEEDEGVYHCIATNHDGSLYSGS